jgi:hypothetical protein
MINHLVIENRTVDGKCNYLSEDLSHAAVCC